MTHLQTLSIPYAVLNKLSRNHHIVNGFEYDNHNVPDFPKRLKSVNGKQIQQSPKHLILEQVDLKGKNGERVAGIVIGQNQSNGKPDPLAMMGFNNEVHGETLSYLDGFIDSADEMKRITFDPTTMKYRDTDRKGGVDSFTGRTLSGDVYDVNLLEGTYEVVNKQVASRGSSPKH